MLNESVFATESLFVVGNINRDVKTAPLRPGSHLFEDGEDSVAAISETIGGGGANAAAAAAGLGARSAFVGKVGADALGSRLRKALVEQGVAVYLREDPGHATGTSINLTYETGHRHFLSCLPNNESLSMDDIDLSALSEYEHLYRADIWFSEPMLFGGNQQLFETARRSGVTNSIDLNWDPQWSTAKDEEVRRRKEAVRRVLPLVNLVHGNIRELNHFADCSNLAKALKCLETWGAETVIVHMGAEGTGYYSRGVLTVERPAPVRQFVNTTGTGDVLSVCMMLMQRRADIPLKDRLRLANSIVAEFIEGRRQFIPNL